MDFSTGLTGATNGITSGPDGNLWFTEFNNSKVGRITPTGTVTEFAAGAEPNRITTGPDGNLWFTESATASAAVGRITTKGNLTEFALPPANATFSYGMTIGPDGNLWTADISANVVDRITPLGAITAFPVPAAKSGPSATTTGPDGNLWFTEQNSNQIGRLSLLSATAAPMTLSVGQAFAGPVATFQDIDPAALATAFAARVSWGDGTTSAGTIIVNAAGSLEVDAAHTYLQVGSYSATVTVFNANRPLQTPTSSATASFTATVNVATHLAFLQQPSSEFVGQPLSPAVSVGIEDSNDHIVTSDNTSTITLSLASNNFGASLGGPVSVQAVNGIATFSNMSVGRAGNGYTLLAGDGGLVGAQSAPFNITSVDVGVGTDNQARLLWDNLDGRARVQSITNSFQASNTQVFGPLAGYTAQRVATGGDGLTRLLWTHADGSFAVWVLNASNVPISEPGFAPLPGEAAVDLAVGSDNKARVLWDYTDGRAAVGTVDTAGNISNVQVFGPFAGYSGAHLAAGSDGSTRLLWTHTSGAFAVWLLNASNVPTSEPSFGPFAGLTATDIAVGSDNKARVLLVGANGAPNILTIDSTGTISNQQALGASPGYLPIALASGGDGLTRLVWDHQDGSVALYLLNQDNSYNSGTGFSPWTPGSPSQASGRASDFTGADVPPPIVDTPTVAVSAAAPPAVVASIAPVPHAIRQVAVAHHPLPPAHHPAPVHHPSNAAHKKTTRHPGPHHAPPAKKK